MTIYSPSPGYDWNPLRRHRNIACPCGSNLKAKRCHGSAEIIPTEAAKAIKMYLRELSALGLIRGRQADARPKRT